MPGIRTPDSCYFKIWIIFGLRQDQCSPCGNKRINTAFADLRLVDLNKISDNRKCQCLQAFCRVSSMSSEKSAISNSEQSDQKSVAADRAVDKLSLEANPNPDAKARTEQTNSVALQSQNELSTKAELKRLLSDAGSLTSPEAGKMAAADKTKTALVQESTNSADRSSQTDNGASDAGSALARLIRAASDNGLKCADKACNFLGEKTTLYGFDEQTGAGIVSRVLNKFTQQIQRHEADTSSGTMRDIGGRPYTEIKLNGNALYQAADGSIYKKETSDNKTFLEEIPGLKAVSADKLSIDGVTRNGLRENTTRQNSNLDSSASSSELKTLFTLMKQPHGLLERLGKTETPIVKPFVEQFAFLDKLKDFAWQSPLESLSGKLSLPGDTTLSSAQLSLKHQFSAARTERTLQEVQEKQENSRSTERLSPKALAQSNDYATQHLLSEPLQDGFKTAGQFRTFTADGAFNGSDRAATVVDRSKDQKLNEIIADAKAKFAELPDREKARALADYVNKIMGPADGNEKALDERYRAMMTENAGKSMMLSEFLGNGSCTQRALLLKVLADEMGLKSDVVRGNGGAHVWNTFSFNDGKKEIFDTRAQIYGVETSPMHKPMQGSAETVNSSTYTAGQIVNTEGKSWTVKGYNNEDGRLVLERRDEKALNAQEMAKLAGAQAKEINTLGSKITLTNEQGKQEDWTFDGKTADGKYKLSRAEEKHVSPHDLSESVLEMAGGKRNPHVDYLQSNWKQLVTDNPKLSTQQKESLETSRRLLEENANNAGDFRKIVDAISKLGQSGAPDAGERINALTKLANTAVNYADAVHLPIERIIAPDTNLTALKQVAESFAQSAPFEMSAPTMMDGTPARDGDAYEHAASQALQKALQDQYTLDRLVKEGKFPPGEWVFVPSSKGSVADDMKIDGMLVDLKSDRAIFIDFARQDDKGGYSKLIDKLDPSKSGNTFSDGSLKHPYALTLDHSSIGFNPTTGENSGKVSATKVLERVGAFMRGTQLSELGIRQVQQGPAKEFSISRLKSALGGRFFNFAPVNGETEAAVISRETGTKTLARQTELEDIAKRSKSNPELRFFGNAASSAVQIADEPAHGVDFFANGLRAAVEMDKQGLRDTVFPTDKPMTTSISVGNDTEGPTRYKNQPFIKIVADDRTKSEYRIYQNGDVLVKANGGRDFHPIGSLDSLSQKLGQALRQADMDNADFAPKLKELRQLKGRAFQTAMNDIEALGKKEISAQEFYKRQPGLKLLAEGLEHGSEVQRSAQESGQKLELRSQIDKDEKLASLSEAARNEIAAKYLQLKAQGRTDLSFREIARVISLEKAGMKIPDAVDATRFQAKLGPAAEAWTAEEIKTNFESAKKAQETDYRSVNELTEVFKLQQLQKQFSATPSEARLYSNLIKEVPTASNSELIEMKRMYDAMKANEVRGTNAELTANTFKKFGAMSNEAIAEWGKLTSSLKKLPSDQLATMAVNNLKAQALFGVDASKAAEINKAASDLAKTGTAPELAHEVAALQVLKNIKGADALDQARLISEMRSRSSGNTSYDNLLASSRVLQSVRALAPESIRAEMETLIAESIKKNGADLAALKTNISEELFNRGTSQGANEADWAKLFDHVDSTKSVDEFAKLLNLPGEQAERAAALDAYRRSYIPDSGDNAPATPSAVSASDLEARLKGNQTYERLTDASRMTDGLKQLTDRALQRMPEANNEKAEFLNKQLKAALRKQLGVSTDAELPESIRNMKIKITDSNDKAPKLVQAAAGDPATIEIPASLLKDNPKGALVDAYTHASGLGIIDALHQKGNEAVGIQALKPVLQKIASQAELIVGARSLALTADKPAVPVNTEAAASERPIRIPQNQTLVSSWDGENLVFGGEKFQLGKEIQGLEKERESRVKALEQELKKAQELAEQSKAESDIAKAKELETRLAAEQQDYRVVSELRAAMEGQRGANAQERARSYVKAATEKAIQDRMSNRGGGAVFSRANAAALVITTLAFMYVNSAPAQAETYTSSFR